MLSKTETIVRNLVDKGWYVDDEGFVTKPNGGIRDLVVRKGKGNSPDYLVFNVKHKGEAYPVPVHILAATARFGPRKPGKVTRHLNGNSLDNSGGNLAYGTQSDNMLDRTKEELSLTGVKQSLSSRKLSDSDVDDIRRLGLSNKDIREKYNVSKRTASSVRMGHTYKILERDLKSSSE